MLIIQAETSLHESPQPKRKRSMGLTQPLSPALHTKERAALKPVTFPFLLVPLFQLGTIQS